MGISRHFLVCVNFPVLFVIAFGEGVTERMAQMNNLLYHNMWYKLLFGIVCPAGSTLLYIYAFPYLKRHVYKYTRDREAELLKIKQEKDNSILLTLEDSIQIRREMAELKAAHTATISDLVEEIGKRDQTITEMKARASQPTAVVESPLSKPATDEVARLSEGILQQLGDDVELDTDRLARRNGGDRLLVRYVIDLLRDDQLIIENDFNGYLSLTPRGRNYLINQRLKK